MTRHLIIPPAQVWDRIEKILDEQDIARERTNKLISDSLKKSGSTSNFSFFLAAIFGVGLVALIILNLTRQLRQS